MTTSDYTPEITYGYCHCGCGQKTNISNWTDKRRGTVKGQPVNYIVGHAIKQTFEQRLETFWNKVNKEGSIPTHVSYLGKCWEWIGGLDTHGYGQFCLNEKTILVHKLSWIIVHGEIPDRLWVLHKCDNPKCVNPEHLVLGTAKDNAQDRERKGRGNSKRFGEGSSTHKLTTLEIIEIRNAYAADKSIDQYELATKYNVSRCHVNGIINNVRRKNG